MVTEWTRLEEVMGYARGMGYRKIGIAHCVGLTREARVLKDILFTQHSKAPATTFIVKDRVLGHNPAVALYSNYYKRRLGG